MTYLEVDLSINPKLVRNVNYKGLSIELWKYDLFSVAFTIVGQEEVAIHNSLLSFGSSLDAEYHAMLYIDAL